MRTIIFKIGEIAFYMQFFFAIVEISPDTDRQMQLKRYLEQFGKYFRTLQTNIEFKVVMRIGHIILNRQ